MNKTDIRIDNHKNKVKSLEKITQLTPVPIWTQYFSPFSAK